jgi:hypothetical protein
MAQFNRINILQVGGHIFVFTEPQIIEWKRNEDSVTMHATLRLHQQEEHLQQINNVNANNTEVSPERI